MSILVFLPRGEPTLFFGKRKDLINSGVNALMEGWITFLHKTQYAITEVTIRIFATCCSTKFRTQYWKENFSCKQYFRLDGKMVLFKQSHSDNRYYKRKVNIDPEIFQYEGNFMCFFITGGRSCIQWRSKSSFDSIASRQHCAQIKVGHLLSQFDSNRLFNL